MTTFDDRKDAFERKFALDEEQKFKAGARRNRLLGEWAGEKLGKSGDDLAAYVKDVIAADFAEVGDEDVFRKLRADLPADVSDEEIRLTMLQLLEKAAADVKAGV